MFGSCQRAGDRSEDNEHPGSLLPPCGSEECAQVIRLGHKRLLNRIVSSGQRSVVLHYIYAFYSLNSPMISKLKTNRKDFFLACVIIMFKLSH